MHILWFLTDVHSNRKFGDATSTSCRDNRVTVITWVNTLIHSKKQESPADARITRDSAVIPGWRLFQDGRQPPSWILSNRKYAIRSADPEHPCLDMEWIGCTVCEIFAFKLYCELETGVRGHSRSSKVALFDTAHTILYSSSIANMNFDDIYLAVLIQITRVTDTERRMELPWHIYAL